MLKEGEVRRQWPIPIILAVWETEIGRNTVDRENPICKTTRAK
jgi:hypothetical protein